MEARHQSLLNDEFAREQIIRFSQGNVSHRFFHVVFKEENKEFQVIGMKFESKIIKKMMTTKRSLGSKRLIKMLDSELF